MRTIIIGLGNPILGDDGVGWKVAQEVQRCLGLASHAQGGGEAVNRPEASLEVDAVALGGLSLMERLIGYDRVILIDAMQTGTRPVGSVHVCALEDLPNPSAGHSTSAHDTSLMTALTVGRQMGLPLPQQLDVVAIEVERVYDFSEELSPPVAAAVPQACQAVLDLLQAGCLPPSCSSLTLEQKESA